MRDTRLVDVLIVGAGPAGTSAARTAAGAGADVLVIERRRRIGEPVRCAEYIPRLLTQAVKIPPEVISQEIRGMITFLPGGEQIRKNAPGFILNRAEFDRALAGAAEKAGAEFLTGTKAISREGDRVSVKGPSGDGEVRAKVIVGADGPHSRVGSWIGQRNKKFLWARQHTVELKVPAHDTEVYLGTEYPGGYGWLFPKGRLANVGVGLQMASVEETVPALRAFEARLGDRIGRVIDGTAGYIPAGGPLPSIDKDARVILVGDAAGHTHPITGGGIPQAVTCGAMAGQAAAAIAGGDTQAFEDYVSRWRRVFGAALDKAAEKRVALEEGWRGEDPARLLRKCWVACREYYHDA
ncbi:MAG: NAD(P)/FAD-dependent oxidoreductase [Desulfobacteraceae bacterium]|nr:NAD(P)/FAD-dependent oxidoreductase [Desulfobacteraceae bacterium]